jgi:hypothetical protein
MQQLFSARADRRLRLGMLAGAIGLGALGLAAWAFARSDRTWGVGVAAPQPIPFSHAIHAGGLGLDCRYCHATVERAASAGMPTAETCLGCHRQVWSVSAQFVPLETALALGGSVAWSSVHRLPGHVRFHHGAHVAGGVPCGTCHGAVEAMPRTVKVETMSMGWCLDCHRGAVAGSAIAQAGAGAYAHFGIALPPLTRCSTCHR